MKMMIVLILSLMSSLTFAGETPFARTCRIAGGQPWVLDVGSKDDLMLCLFNSAAVGAAEFAVYKWDKGEGQSLTAFKSQTSQLNSDTVCQDFGAAQRISQDSEGSSWRLCVFADKSVIEEQTLANGVNFPGNEALAQALR